MCEPSRKERLVDDQARDYLEDVQSSKSPRKSVFSRLGESKRVPCRGSSSKRALESNARLATDMMPPPLPKPPTSLKEVDEMAK